MFIYAHTVHFESGVGQHGKALEMSHKALGIQEKKLAANPNHRGIAVLCVCVREFESNV